MLRRIPVIAASAAMLMVSAVPAYAAATHARTHSVTHAIAFPHLHGVKAWGTYTRSGKRVHINVCVTDTSRSDFAVGAVMIASNSGNKRQSRQGAIAIGYGQTVCRSENLRYTTHLRAYTIAYNGQGKIAGHSANKKIY